MEQFLVRRKTTSVEIPRRRSTTGESPQYDLRFRWAQARHFGTREGQKLRLSDNLGGIAATDKDYGQAADDYEHASRRDPALKGVDDNWGRAAFAAHRYSQALSPLGCTLTAHPEDVPLRSIDHKIEKSGNWQDQSLKEDQESLHFFESMASLAFMLGC